VADPGLFGHVAKRLDVKGRSSMTKTELAEAIDKANRKANEKARS
jgi:hypothetical protein